MSIKIITAIAIIMMDPLLPSSMIRFADEDILLLFQRAYSVTLSVTICSVIASPIEESDQPINVYPELKGTATNVRSRTEPETNA